VRSGPSKRRVCVPLPSPLVDAPCNATAFFEPALSRAHASIHRGQSPAFSEIKSIPRQTRKKGLALNKHTLVSQTRQERAASRAGSGPLARAVAPGRRRLRQPARLRAPRGAQPAARIAQRVRQPLQLRGARRVLEQYPGGVCGGSACLGISPRLVGSIS
jgi:hypothetical protein